MISMYRIARIVGWRCGVTAISFAAASMVFGQGAASDEQKKPLTPETSLSLRSVGELQFSADGSRLAFVVTEPAKGTGRLRHIWIYDRQGGVLRQFTSSTKSEFVPRWSPDGQQLAF